MESFNSPRYELNGEIDVDATVSRLLKSRHPNRNLREALWAVWADAYERGWNDGQNDADPDMRDNPYGKF